MNKITSWSYPVKFKSNINRIRVICCMDIKKGWIEWVTSQEVISMILKVVSHLKQIMIPTTTFLHVDTQITQTIKWSLATIVTWFKVYLYLIFMTCLENHETWLESMNILLMGFQSPVLWEIFSTSVTTKSHTLMNWLLMVILTANAAWFMCT